jgi:hypothetical protein
MFSGRKLCVCATEKAGASQSFTDVIAQAWNIQQALFVVIAGSVQLVYHTTASLSRSQQQSLPPSAWHHRLGSIKEWAPPQSTANERLNT